jgi:hypothetical protein
MTDGLSQTYAELLDGSYDSLDRIVLNAYFRFAQNPAGFRVWWRQLHGSDEDLDNAHLMRLAGRFRRRLRAWALANNVPTKVCKAGEHKFEIADEYLAKTDVREGVFLIIEGRAPASVFDVLKSGCIQVQRPYVITFRFTSCDADWGHVVIKLSGHPPFPAQIILNGHEYLARQAERNGIPFTKEGNCFTHVETGDAFAAIAETLLSERAAGLLTAVCDRWIYKACLCFALDAEERKRSRFRYEYSTYQLEYSRNLLFKRGSEMERVMEALVDRNRSRMDVERPKRILGRKARPHVRKKRKPTQLQVVVERLQYGLTIFKVYCGKVALKIYTKGERVLRTEAMAIDARSLGCGRDIGRFAAAASTLKNMLERFLNLLTCMDRCFVGPDTLEELSSPSKVGIARTGGIDLNRVRMRYVARAILALSIRPSGFSASQIAEHVRAQAPAGNSEYGSRQAAYDLQKFQCKGLVYRLGKRRRYSTNGEKVRAISALLLIRDRVLIPLLAAAVNEPSEHCGQPEVKPVDQLYLDVRSTMRRLLEHLGVAA